jgi:hypothetical protein
MRPPHPALLLEDDQVSPGRHRRDPEFGLQQSDRDASGLPNELRYPATSLLRYQYLSLWYFVVVLFYFPT